MISISINWKFPAYAGEIPLILSFSDPSGLIKCFEINNKNQ